MKRKFSTYVNILEQDDIEHVMKASKNDFTYMLKEFAAWKDKSAGEKHVARKAMSPQQQKELDEYEAAQNAKAGVKDPPEELSDIEPVARPPEELSDIEPVEQSPEEPVEEPARQPVEEPVEKLPGSRSQPVAGFPPANNPDQGMLGKTLGKLKDAGKAIDGGINWLASGQPTGTDPKQLSSIMKNVTSPESQEVIDTLVAQVPGINSNPAIGERLISLLQQKTGVKPKKSKTNAKPGGKAVVSLPAGSGGGIQGNSGKFDENWKDNLKKIAGVIPGGIQKGAAYMNKVGVASKNLHQATGGKNGTQGSQMGRLVTGDLQRTNQVKSNYHDFLKTAINKPEALDDHPTWVDFMQTSTPAQKQAFMDYVQQSVQQYSGPPPTSPPSTP